VVAGKNIARKQKEHALGERMADRMQHCAGHCHAAHAYAQSQNAHVLNAGIGQHALVVALPHNKDGGCHERKNTEKHEHAARKPTKPRSQHDLVPAQHAQHGAVEQRARKQGRNQRRRLTVRIGQPVVQWGEAHLGAVAHQQKNKGRLEPRGFGKGRVAHKPAHLIHAVCCASGAFRTVERHGKQYVAQQSQGNAHGAYDQVLPGGFQRTLVTVKINELGAGKGGRFNTHPLRAHVRRDGHKRHGPEKKAQTGREAALRGVGEAAMIQNVGVFADALFFPQVMHCIERRGQKQQARQHQKQHAQSVRGQQAAKFRGRFSARDLDGN